MTDGLPGACKRIDQLTMNSARITRLPPPCHKPTDLARVPDGIANQSMVPTAAASSPPIKPAAIIQKAISDQYPLPVIKCTISKITDVINSPSGNSTSMGCIACPIDLTLLSIVVSLFLIPYALSTSAPPPGAGRCCHAPA